MQVYPGPDDYKNWDSNEAADVFGENITPPKSVPHCPKLRVAIQSLKRDSPHDTRNQPETVVQSLWHNSSAFFELIA